MHALGFLKNQDSCLKNSFLLFEVLGPSAPKTNIVVTVIGIVVVAISRSRVPLIVVPGTAAGCDQTTFKSFS